MHFNVYFDDETGQALNRVAEQTGETRNALIRTAVSQWLATRGAAGWPSAVLKFEGVPDMPLFEAARDGLRPPADDPLA